MQNLFAEKTPWNTPWMKRVLPVVTRIAEHHPERTVFTRFIPARHPEELAGSYRRWAELTLERIDPRLLELVPPLDALTPPATVIDKRSIRRSPSPPYRSCCIRARSTRW